MSDMPTAVKPDTIVLIHGLWMTPRSWEQWVARYEARGFKVLAPAFPGLEVEVEALRADPAPIETLTVDNVVAHYAAIIRALDSPPIIIGHSFGGALVQLLLDRGLAAAGVAIEANPVRGVSVAPLSTLRGIWPVLKNPANRQRAVPLTLEQFHKDYANTLSRQDATAVYERYHIPAPGGIVFNAVTAIVNPRAPNTVDFNKPDRTPLLFIAGELDRLIPPAINRSNARHYRTGIVAYREFAGRSHCIWCEAGWQAVADYALNWALNPVAAKP